MKHRIFIAINLPKEVKEKLLEYQEKWPELPVRWVKRDNLHITLVFLGYLKDEHLPKLREIIRKTSQRHSPFVLNLNKICYGPPKKIPPRMIWIEGEKNENLAQLKEDLEGSLLDSGILRVAESRKFSPHITLGRINRWEWRRIEPEERPEIEEFLSLSFEVNSIEIMESKLKRGGAEYSILETCNLKLKT